MGEAKSLGVVFGIRILGIDLGSRAVKIVILENGKPIEKKLVDTASFYKDFARNLDNRISIKFESLGLGSFDKVVSTGYGRNNVNIENAEVIVELKAHTFGAIWQTGLENFTLLDIGGQDSKVISVKKGKMADIILNDKCAASCGRYLENMANILGISIENMEQHSKNPVELSSTCAVFGESELIGRISEGYKVEQLAAGVNYSLFRRIKPMLERFTDKTLVLTGGVAKNHSIVNYIRSELEYDKIVIPDEPQFNGAIGCCVYVMKKYEG